MFDTAPRRTRVPAPDATAAELRENATSYLEIADGCEEHAAHLVKAAARYREQAASHTARANELELEAPAPSGQRPVLTVVSTS